MIGFEENLCYDKLLVMANCSLQTIVICELALRLRLKQVDYFVQITAGHSKRQIWHQWSISVVTIPCMRLVYMPKRTHVPSSPSKLHHRFMLRTRIMVPKAEV